MWLVSIELPMPPTINKAYITTRSGRRILSTEGKAYKQQVKVKVGLLADLKSIGIADTPVRLEIDLYLPVLNKGWSMGKTKSRYKRVDVSNRVKLIEDAFFESIGVDDSQVFVLIVRKHNSDEQGALLSLFQEDHVERDEPEPD